jgi:hypothetical protein
MKKKKQKNPLYGPVDERPIYGPVEGPCYGSVEGPYYGPVEGPYYGPEDSPRGRIENRLRQQRLEAREKTIKAIQKTYQKTYEHMKYMSKELGEQLLRTANEMLDFYINIGKYIGRAAGKGVLKVKEAMDEKYYI